MTAISIRLGEKSYERARFAGERALFVRIVVFSLVFAGPFDVLDCMDQMAVGNHGVMGGLLEFSRAVILGGAALMLGGMLEQFGGFQMMIDAFLRHIFKNSKPLPSRDRRTRAGGWAGCQPADRLSIGPSGCSPDRPAPPS
jgi:hypothetical protein